MTTNARPPRRGGCSAGSDSCSERSARAHTVSRQVCAVRERR
jgi:hypothetical protein